MANPLAKEANPVETIENFHKNNWNRADVFKALDFSNVAIYAGEAGGGAVDDEGVKQEDFRHFHQMRLFIQGGTVTKHRNRINQNILISSNLPEQIQYNLRSKWERPISFGQDGLFNLLMQMGIPQAPSGTHRSTTFRIWTDTDPLILKLRIPVIDDGASSSGTNLVEALEILGSLVLPHYRQKDTLGFYDPPPSPLNVTYDYENISPDKAKRREVKGELKNINKTHITLQLGGILLVDNCIIESVGVTYPNTKAMIKHNYGNEVFGRTRNEYLHPLLAIVDLEISTIEALTTNTYSKMLWLDSQEGQGTLDASDATKGASKLVNGAIDISGFGYDSTK